MIPMLHVSMALIVSALNYLMLNVLFLSLSIEQFFEYKMYLSLWLLILYALNANHVQFKSENLQIINIRKSAVLVYLVINSSKNVHQIRKALSSSIIF